MKSIEKWADENLDLVIITAICLALAIWIYLYMYDSRMLQSGNARPGSELVILCLPIAYLSMTWKGRIKCLKTSEKN